jgi:hypothetical protein
MEHTAAPLPPEAMENYEEYEEEIYLTKKNGVWQMDKYKDGMVSTIVGKELVIALLDVENPIAATFVDGAVLGRTYSALHLKASLDKEVKHHECFDASIEDIENVLKNDGLVLAFSPNQLPMTPKLIQYADEHGITLPQV